MLKFINHLFLISGIKFLSFGIHSGLLHTWMYSEVLKENEKLYENKIYDF